MIVIVAKSVVKPGCMEQYRQLAGELAAKSRKEPGCHYYDVYQDLQDEAVLTFLESWEDQAAIDRHNASEHFTRIVPQLRELRDSSEVARYQRLAL